VPAERGGSKERWLPGKDQEGEFEGLGETDVLELDRISASCCKVSPVERSAETSISRAAGGHTNTCSQKAEAVADRSEADIGDLDTDAGLRFGWSSGRRTVRSAAGTRALRASRGRAAHDGKLGAGEIAVPSELVETQLDPAGQQRCAPTQCHRRD